MANTNNDSMEMTDYQKVQMTQISYLDFEDKDIEALKGKKLSDVEQYLSTPDLWSMGAQFNSNDNGIMNKIANGVVKCVIGEDAFTTDRQLYDHCVESGFGDLTIKDIANNPETGFQAIALEDQYGNTYISFRGSDGNFEKGMQHDWIDADLKEFVLDDKGEQIQQAVEFFDKNKSENGQTSLYGHSLGGNLTQHVFLQRENEVDNAFCYNANAVNPALIDTQEKQDALHSDRFTFAIASGDVVSGFKDTSSYENRVVYVQNSEIGKGNILNDHLAEAASYDKDGNFIQTDKWQCIDDRGDKANAVLDFMHNAKDWLNNHEETAKCLVQICEKKWPDNLDKVMQELGPEAKEWCDNLKESWKEKLGLDMDLGQLFDKGYDGIRMDETEQELDLTSMLQQEDQKLGEMVPQLSLGGNMAQDKDFADILYDASQEVEELFGGAASAAVNGLIDLEEDDPEEEMSFDRIPN